MNYLYLIPALPFAGFLILALLGRLLSKKVVALVGVGSVGISALLAVITAIEFAGAQPQVFAYTQTLWTWIQFDGYSQAISLSLDALSLVMILVVTIVGFFIHLYSSEFMADDEGYSRFFAYMNLFVGSMLTLVLADNLLLLYLGWEGVGLCSYLLIGFWYRDPTNGYAARKAFIVTRIGDTAMALGLFLLFWNLGTLNIQELMQKASMQWDVGSGTAVLAAALLLGDGTGPARRRCGRRRSRRAQGGPRPRAAAVEQGPLRDRDRPGGARGAADRRPRDGRGGR